MELWSMLYCNTSYNMKSTYSFVAGDVYLLSVGVSEQNFVLFFLWMSNDLHKRPCQSLKPTIKLHANQATWAWVICTKKWKHLGGKCNHSNELNITNESIFTRREYGKHCFIINSLNLLLKFPLLCLSLYHILYVTRMRTHTQTVCTRTHTYLQ